jgi:hypothetical protein
MPEEDFDKLKHQVAQQDNELNQQVENIKETKSKFNWKEWRESHPLAVIGGVFIVAVTLTSACWSWFSGEHLMLAQEHAANELDKAKKELQAKIDDCNSRFSSIERHVGDRSFWDLSAMMVTPIQMKNLGQNYVYYDDIHCYLSIPDSASWKPLKTTGIGMQMLFGNPKPSDETDPFIDFDKTRKIYIWRGPGSFSIDTIDVETPILYIFPYVSIEEVNNQAFSEMLMTVTKKLELRFEEIQTQFVILGHSFTTSTKS